MSTAGSTPPQVDQPATGARDTRPALRRYRSPLVVVGAAAAVLGAIVLGGGGSDDDEFVEESYDYDAVCVDATETRVDDERCAEEGAQGSGVGGGAFWYFIAAGRLAPAIGARATGGSRVAPDPARFSVNTGGVDPRGGTVSRGGFGRGGGGGGGSVGG
jgi:hypothetical protein